MLLFRTNGTQGIVFREHTPYYIQELEAPVGYLCDGTKHWFLFCEEETGKCTYESEIEGIQIIPGDQLGTLQIRNTRVAYVLPETGGAGATIFYVLGGVLMLAAVMLMFTKKRKNGTEQ